MLQQWAFINTPQKSTNCVRNRIFDAKNGYLEATFCEVIIFNLWLNENAFSLARSLLLGIHMFSIKFDMSILNRDTFQEGNLDYSDGLTCTIAVFALNASFFLKQVFYLNVQLQVRWNEMILEGHRKQRSKTGDQRTQKMKTKTREARNFYTFPRIW